MSKGEQTRQEIVDRALALAGEVGLEGVSLGVLAAGMSLSKSGLFAHFGSKEALQVEVVREAIERFIREVVAPALATRRGEARVRALWEGNLDWIKARGRCFFMALSQEYDDRPGPVRELVAQSQRDWYDTVARVARTAVEEGQFRADLDADQFAFELVALGMAFQQVYKLLGDPDAERRARAGFEALMARSRIPESPRA